MDEYEDYYLCDDCEVKEYCRDIDKEHMDERCIYNDIDDCFYYYDTELDDIVEYSEEEQNERMMIHNKIIDKRIVEFKRKRKYKKIKL